MYIYICIIHMYIHIYIHICIHVWNDITCYPASSPLSPARSAAFGAPAAVNYLPGISLFLSGVFFQKNLSECVFLWSFFVRSILLIVSSFPFSTHTLARTPSLPPLPLCICTHTHTYLCICVCVCVYVDVCVYVYVCVCVYVCVYVCVCVCGCVCVYLNVCVHVCVCLYIQIFHVNTYMCRQYNTHALKTCFIACARMLASFSQHATTPAPPRKLHHSWSPTLETPLRHVVPSLDVHQVFVSECECECECVCVCLRAYVFLSFSDAYFGEER